MWSGHENALCLYGITICAEWTARGYKDTCSDKIRAYFNLDKHLNSPVWFGDEDFHKAHRSNLLRKDFTYYSKYFQESI